MSRSTEDQAMFAIPDQLRSHTLQGYFAVVPYGKLELVSFKSSRGAESFVPEAHRIYAVELCQALNRHIAHGGKWIVCWCEFDLSIGMPRHLAMLWMDADGDIPFVVDSDEDLATQIYGLDDYVEQCAQAYAQWREMLRDVGVASGQTIAAARGEASADPRAQPDIIPFH